MQRRLMLMRTRQEQLGRGEHGRLRSPFESARESGCAAYGYLDSPQCDDARTDSGKYGSPGSRDHHSHHASHGLSRRDPVGSRSLSGQSFHHSSNDRGSRRPNWKCHGGWAQPGLEQLVSAMCGQYRDFPTAAFASFLVDLPHWKNLIPDAETLVWIAEHFVTPKGTDA